MPPLKQFETFGRLIVWLREKQKLTRCDLARQSGLSRQTLHKLEMYGCPPSFDTVRRIASALGVSLDEIAARMPDLE